MKIPESDRESAHSVSLESAPRAGPSSHGLDVPGTSNGHTNGFALSPTNGNSNGAGPIGNGVQKHKSIAKVSLPGTALYDDDSYVDREEFVRLVVQSLRDVGYMYVSSLFSLERFELIVLSPLAENPQRLLRQNLATRWRAPKSHNFEDIFSKHHGLKLKKPSCG